MALPVLLVVLGVAVAVARPSGPDRSVVAAGGPTTTTALGADDDVPTTTVPLVETTLPSVPSTPTTGTIPKRIPPTTGTTSTTLAPGGDGGEQRAKWCAYGRGHGYRSVQDGMPAEIAVSVTVAPAVVRSGEPVTVTIKARNTTDEAITYDRGTVFNSVEVRPVDDDQQVVWERYFQDGQDVNRSGAEHFEPGEEKVEQVMWKSDVACDAAGGGGYKAGLAPTGRYQIEASWDTHWHDPVYVEVRP